MMLLRAVVGFMLFLMAFWLRDQSAGTAKFGLALSTAAIATVIGNAERLTDQTLPQARSRCSSERSAMAGVAGLAAALIGGIPAMVGLAFVANLAASIGRLGFEAMLQRDAPDANRGRAFAMFETRFQLSWAAAGLIPVVIEMSGPTGALVIGSDVRGGRRVHAAPPSPGTRSVTPPSTAPAHGDREDPAPAPSRHRSRLTAGRRAG